MNFKISQKLFSMPRMRKYLNACNGDKRVTMQLYRYNLRLCQRFYGTLNLFEVMLRNAINEHYATRYSDPDWIVNQAKTGKLLEFNKDEINQTEAGYRNRGIYNNDKMVSSLTMGFGQNYSLRKDTKEAVKHFCRYFQTKRKERANLISIKTSLTSVNSVIVLPIMNLSVLMDQATSVRLLPVAITN